MPDFTCSIEILVGGRDDAHIDLDRSACADRVDLALLQRAQELDLGLERQFADFVEKEGAGVGLAELADVLLGRAGERALLVAEQDRLDQCFGERAAVDGDERLAAPLRAALDRARQELLADAGFAFDQHGNVRLGSALGKPHRAGHRIRTGDDVAKGEHAGVAPIGAAELVFQRVDPEGVLDRKLQPLGADRLDDEVDCAGAHRRDDGLDRAVRRLHDRRHRDLALAQALEHAHAVKIGHDKVENDEADRRTIGRLDPRQRRRARVYGFHVVAEPPRHRFQQAALNWIVVDDKDEGGHGSSRTAARLPRRPRQTRTSG